MSSARLSSKCATFSLPYTLWIDNVQVSSRLYSSTPTRVSATLHVIACPFFSLISHRRSLIVFISGQLCTDLEEVIQAQYHQQIFAVLIPTLEVPEPRYIPILFRELADA